MLQGRMNGGADNLVDVSMEDGGQYVPEDTLNDSAMSRDPNPQTRRRMPTDESDPRSHDNLVNGECVPTAESELLPDSRKLWDRDPDGMQRRPVPPQRSVEAGELPYGRKPSLTAMTDNVVATAGVTQVGPRLMRR